MGVGGQYQRRRQTFCIYLLEHTRQSSSWIGRKIFKHWVFHTFLPVMKERFHKIGMPENSTYTLFLDNCTVHLWIWLCSGNISVLYLPPTAVAQWLRCCATNRKVAGSISDGVTGIFHWHNPSDRIMALGSTRPLTEMSTRSICWGQKRPVHKGDNLTTMLAIVT